MSLDRTPEIAGGITVFSAIAAKFAEDPLGAMGSAIAVVVGVLACISWVIRICKQLRSK